MARPKKEKQYEKDKRITVRFTELEFNDVRERSKKCGMTAAEYIREQVSLGKVEVCSEGNTALDDIMPLTEEFHKIGINLNQIAHHLNGGGEFTESIKKELITRADDLRILTKKIISLAEE